eukprot:3494096-Pleurochrysis_carterae.AAC.1
MPDWRAYPCFACACAVCCCFAAIGDGQTYSCIVRTSLYESDGIEYVSEFKTAKGKFSHARLPFANFVAYKDNRRVSDISVRELDRLSISAMAIAYYPQRNPPVKGEPASQHGAFCLSLVHIKAFRERDEPEL